MGSSARMFGGYNLKPKEARIIAIIAGQPGEVSIKRIAELYLEWRATEEGRRLGGSPVSGVPSAASVHGTLGRLRSQGILKQNGGRSSKYHGGHGGFGSAETYSLTERGRKVAELIEAGVEDKAGERPLMVDAAAAKPLTRAADEAAANEYLVPVGVRTFALGLAYMLMAGESFEMTVEICGAKRTVMVC